MLMGMAKSIRERTKGRGKNCSFRAYIFSGWPLAGKGSFSFALLPYGAFRKMCGYEL